MYVYLRYPGLDDQAVFWRVIRRSIDPPVHPLGIYIFMYLNLSIMIFFNTTDEYTYICIYICVYICIHIFIYINVYV
jgi:hypothetical protein